MQRHEATTYLKAITIRDPGDMGQIREDVARGMVLILRVTPLASKDVSKLRALVTELYELAGESGYDIARLGEERIIVTPSRIKIWKPDRALE
ncbi:MAG: cell division protein SepF [Thaumarchaeota archaeon]|nr:cell division protein SepF [Nitrososphaerota archaeon]RNJ73851.1 MAG: DUF552 domain-containing protein [Thaumarchaeota archaeon S14]RNJ74056.1 MAG: DUF552 domain-containing protein [Thaumarchaeota archaeon S13]RNJ76215.1 MAG: DUF552 domain-containing protein [Thaumarchaeota archaeon S15]MDD9808428.1 cell division protein SepF [Nitrososphaerota archaeon]